MGEKRRRYLSYLLCLWQADGTEKQIWRASLEGAHTRKRVGFPSLDALFAYLQRETDAGPDTGRDECEETARSKCFRCSPLSVRRDLHRTGN